MILDIVIHSILNGIPFALIVITNVLLSYIALKNTMNVYTNGKSRVTDVKSKLCCFKNCLSDTQNQKQKRINRVFFGLLLPTLISRTTYVVSCTPYHPNSLLSCRQVGFCYVMFFCQNVTHPIMETWLIPDVRTL